MTNKFVTSNPYRYSSPEENKYNSSFLHVQSFRELEEDKINKRIANKKHDNSDLEIHSPQKSHSSNSNQHQSFSSPFKSQLNHKLNENSLFVIDSPSKRHILIPNPHSPLNKYDNSYHHNLAPVTHRLVENQNSQMKSFLKYGRIVVGKMQTQENPKQKMQQFPNKLPKKGMLTFS